MARTARRTTSRRPDLVELEHDLTSQVVNLRVVVVRRATGEKLFEVGAPWDRINQHYLPVEPQCKILRLNEAQLDAAREIAAWIEARRAGQKRVIELVLEGARGSGKTHLGVLTIFLVAIAFPGARCWLVSPANTRRDEMDRIIKAEIPRPWRAWSERDLTYTLPNGSTIVFVGADDEDALKQGGYEIALLNEAQLMTVRAYVSAVGGVRNVGGRPKGLLLLAMNYATKTRGDWTYDLIEKIDAGQVNAKRVPMDPRLNASIDADTIDDVDAAARAADPELADRDILGIRIRPGEFACTAFKPHGTDRGGHVGHPPEVGWQDVTRAATASKTSHTAGFPLVVATDFQRRPGCTGVAFRVFQPPIGGRVYYAQKAIGQEGDLEDDLARRIIDYAESLGLHASDVLVIADSTGRFQSGDHSPRSKPSHQVLREWGLTVIPPEYRRKANGARGDGYNGDVPDTLALLHQVCLEDRLLVAQTEEWLVESMRRCKVKKRGGSLRLDDSKPGYSHWVDPCRYTVWCLEPRRGPVPQPASPEVIRALSGIKLVQS